MSKEPITPGKGRGWGFEKKGYQQKNLESLLKILNKKEATEALTALGDTKSETWTDIKDSIHGLNDFVGAGGTGAVLTSIKDSVRESLETSIEGALSPLKNTLAEVVGDIMAPAYEELQNIANDLGEFIAGNKTGAFWGSMIGSIWGQLGILIGGIVGAAIEAWWEGRASTTVDDMITGFSGGYDTPEYFYWYHSIQLDWMRDKFPTPTWDPNQNEQYNNIWKYR